MLGGVEVELLQPAQDHWEGWSLDGDSLPAALQQEVAGQEKHKNYYTYSSYIFVVLTSVIYRVSE